MDKIWWKKIHNLFGLAGAAFLVVLLLTGILLNHPSRLGGEETAVLAADPADGARLLRGSASGLYRSNDGGGRWEEVPMLYPPGNVADIAFVPGRPRTLYLLEKWGRLYRSEDGGALWEVLPLPFDPQSTGIEMKRISAGTGERILLLTSGGWISSQDGGRHWDESHLNKEGRSLRRLVLLLHNGYFFGPAFVWLYDFAALALLILIISGLVLWKIGRSAV